MKTFGVHFFARGPVDKWAVVTVRTKSEAIRWAKQTAQQLDLRLLDCAESLVELARRGVAEGMGV